MELHIGLPSGAAIADQVAFAVAVEQAGFRGIAIGDNPALKQDPYIVLSEIAAATARILLYPAVANPVTSTPEVLAALAGSIEELAPGRSSLVIGSGDIAVRQFGLKPATLDEMQVCILRVRQLLEIHFGYNRPLLGMAASGPKAIALAASVADQLLAQVGFHPQVLARLHEIVIAQSTAANRPAVNIVHAIPISVDSDIEKARARLLPIARTWGKQGVYSLYGALHPEGYSPSPLEVIENAMVACTPDEITSRIAALENAGIGSVLCMFPNDPGAHWDHLQLLSEKAPISFREAGG